ncbi:MAG: diacylglycerol kinase family protein [bacterium]
MTFLISPRGSLALPPRDRAVSNVLLIVNPGSRGGRRAQHVVGNALRDAGITFEAAETSGPQHATSLVRERVSANPGAFDLVLALGGDGTAMEVASGLAQLEDAPPLGIVAAGTANILARSLGIPTNAGRAIAALLDADVASIDIGRVTGGPAFAIGLGIGLDASMIAGTSTRLKRRIGYGAYALSALRAGLRLERFHVRITVDGKVYEAETSSVLVANFGTVLGGVLCFGAEIGHQDGVLDVCLYSPRSYVEAVRIFWRMLSGGVDRDCRVQIIRGRHVRVETDPPRPMQADGELLGLTPVDIRVEPNAVRVLVPRAAPHRWRAPRHAAVRTTPELLESST